MELDGGALAASGSVQQRQLEGWALMHDTKLAAVYVEAGVSGAVPFAKRPEGRKLWAELRGGDTLVVSKLDRAFRSATDCLNVTDQPRQHVTGVTEAQPELFAQHWRRLRTATRRSTSARIARRKGRWQR